MDRISIQGYKSIQHLDLILNPINILIGSNGSGKSNFLSFFEMLKIIYDQKLKEYVALKGGADKFLYNGSKVTEEIETKLNFGNNNAYSFTLKKGDDDFVFIKEFMWHNHPVYVNPLDISSFNQESRLKFSTAPLAFYFGGYINGLEKYHFHDTGYNSPFNKNSNIETDKFFLYNNGENLPAFLFKIYNNYKKEYALIIKTIQSIAPYFSDFYFAPNENGFIKLLWQSKYNSNNYSSTDLSDGTIRFIALATLFLQPNLQDEPLKTIIIDEPELGLHPSAIAKVAGMIKSASAKGCQIILATQSTDLISHFLPEDIITVDQINGASKFQRLDGNSLELWLEDYTIDELWKRNIITTGQLNF